VKKSIKQEEVKPEIIAQPEIKIEPQVIVEPVIEVNTPAIDMIPVANAIKAMQTKIDVHVPEQKKPNIKLHFERDNRGFIKSPITIEHDYSQITEINTDD